MSDIEVPGKLAEPAAEPALISLNKVVSFHYRLAEVSAQGEREAWREESYGGNPLFYIHGFHNVIVGLEKALEGKAVGDSIEITLQPEEAYGVRQPNSVQRVPIKHLQFPGGNKKLRPGMAAVVETNKGRRNVVLVKVGKFNADVDFNHPLSGKVLFYEVKVEGVRDASAEEIAHGHVHGAGGHKH
ncbi:MAG: peptidylprolyl isomerase [SAR86 cluster bacterium]|uniref:Peptidyl-prolyl cis-trans isomerase n=1 Tax=SAR86 cluster bacterium TaxID=2030880 RepID=A0A2A5BA38_9GAMM|nr:MAG: peptidylprolyl isomerase [SAR86 cluster bacterium]